MAVKKEDSKVEELLAGSGDVVAPVESAVPVPADEVIGFRPLSVEDIAWMNTIKSAELELGAVWRNVKELVPSADPRELAIAKTHFQNGFMHFVKAITKPEDAF